MTLDTIHKVKEELENATTSVEAARWAEDWGSKITRECILTRVGLEAVREYARDTLGKDQFNEIQAVIGSAIRHCGQELDRNEV